MPAAEKVVAIRRTFFAHGKAKKEIRREFRPSRNVARNVMRSDETTVIYRRRVQPQSTLGPLIDERDR